MRASKYWIVNPSRGSTTVLTSQHRKLNRPFGKAAFNSIFMRTARWLSQLPLNLI